MTKIALTFEGSSWEEIEDHMRDALALGKLSVPGAATTALNDFPDNADLPEQDTAPEPEAPPPMTAAAPRRSHKKANSVQAPAPATAPEPAPEPLPEPTAKGPAREIPPLDVLKSAVTKAVRAAQKKEGSDKILALLPGFKQKTGLDFVMSAEDKHRVDLFDLVEAAGLELV